MTIYMLLQKTSEGVKLGAGVLAVRRIHAGANNYTQHNIMYNVYSLHKTSLLHCVHERRLDSVCIPTCCKLYTDHTLVGVPHVTSYMWSLIAWIPIPNECFMDEIHSKIISRIIINQFHLRFQKSILLESYLEPEFSSSVESPFVEDPLLPRGDESENLESFWNLLERNWNRP